MFAVTLDSLSTGYFSTYYFCFSVGANVAEFLSSVLLLLPYFVCYDHETVLRQKTTTEDVFQAAYYNVCGCFKDEDLLRLLCTRPLKVSGRYSRLGKSIKV